MKTPPIILASQSPRRAELLSQLGVTFSTVDPAIDERLKDNESAKDYVVRMAHDKARAVCRAYYSENPAPFIILAGDTTVVLGDKILGKPVDRANAIAMLIALSGRSHRVLTAISVLAGTSSGEDGMPNIQEHARCVSTEVNFRRLNGQEIEDYCDSDEPYDKAGSYAIQGLAGAFVASINGSYSAVVGLPLCETYQILSEII
jgi:septum formation protein